jgi:hypothetical protein
MIQVLFDHSGAQALGKAPLFAARVPSLESRREQLTPEHHGQQGMPDNAKAMLAIFR